MVFCILFSALVCARFRCPFSFSHFLFFCARVPWFSAFAFHGRAILIVWLEFFKAFITREASMKSEKGKHEERKHSSEKMRGGVHCRAASITSLSLRWSDSRRVGGSQTIRECTIIYIRIQFNAHCAAGRMVWMHGCLHRSKLCLRCRLFPSDCRGPQQRVDLDEL